jgi:hypothetical protein
MRKQIIILLLIIIPAFTLYGNMVEYVHGGGGALYPLRDSDLIMEKESIIIDAYKGFNPKPPSIKDEYEWGGSQFYYYEYDCEYTFRNTGRRQSFILGFPVKYGKSNFYDWQTEYDPMITDCQIFIGKSKIEYGRYIHGFNPEMNELDYNEVYGFPVSIGKDETMTVRVLYTVVQYFMPYVSSNPEIYYILKTGSLFKKPIGEGYFTVRIHFKGETHVSKNSTEPSQVNQTSESPYMIFRWNLKNFIPDKDLIVDIDEYDFEDKKSVPPDQPMVKISAFQMESNLDTYLALIQSISKFPELYRGKLTGNLTKQMKQFYLTCFSNPAIPDNLSGLLLGDIQKYPQFSPGNVVVSQMKQKLENDVRVHYEKRLAEAKAVLEAVSDNPTDTGYIKEAYKFMKSGQELDLLLSDKDNLPLFKQNIYTLQLFNSPIQKAILDCDKKISLRVTACYKKLYKAAIEKQSDNIAEILELERLLGKNNSLYDFYDNYLAKITALSTELVNRKDKHKEAYTLEKILNCLHSPIDTDDMTYSHDRKDFSYTLMTPDRSWIVFLHREMIRKAYYTLGNYYFMNNAFTKSNRNYGLALAYGTTSPLLDLLFQDEGMSGKRLEWSDTPINDLYKGNFDSVMSVLGSTPPYWHELSRKDILLDEDILRLFTPDRLLKLNLEKWEQEKSNEAPCYYIAYNTACAYARMKKGPESLQWLEVALRMNKDLKATAQKDKDLEYLRTDFAADYARIVKR